MTPVPGNLKVSKHPLPIRIYNGLLGHFEFPSLKFDALLNAARKKTGLSDFGEESFVDPLRHLLAAIEDEAHLHPFGRFITRKRLVNLLCNRLRAEHWFKTYPEILDADVLPVVMITGLQRTGTTMLHRLMASDPDSRSLLSWEALYPAPLTGRAESSPDPRISMARTSEKGLKYIAPEFFAIHPVEHDAPEEEVLLLDVSFLSTAAEAILHVPTFKNWLEEQDQLPGYQYMAKLLKLLQWQKNGKRWILKSPHHLEYLDVLLQAVPQIKIVQTHRDPVETIPSFCNMIYHSRRIFSDQVDAMQIADQWTAKIAYVLGRSMNFRDKINQNIIYDLGYKNMTANPIPEITGVYQFLDLPVSESLVAGWNETLTRNKQHKYGIHNYRSEDFGLTKERIENLLADYRGYFKDFI